MLKNMRSVQIHFLEKSNPANGYFKPSVGFLNGDPYGN